LVSPGLKRVALAAGLACGAALFSAASSSAAVTIGSDLKADFYVGTAGYPCMAGVPCTWVSVRSPAALPQTAPFDGVVVRWRLRSRDDDYARLQVIALGPDDHDRALRNAYYRETVHPGLNVFSERLPIEAGATVGVDDDPGGPQYFGIARQGDHLAWFGPPLPVLGFGSARPTGVTDGLELLMNADIEPDADHDGYGDETQDGCPTDPSTHGACPPNGPTPPDTSTPHLPVAPTPPSTTAPQPATMPPPACTAFFRRHYRLDHVLRTGIVGTARFGAAATARVTAFLGSTVAARGSAALGAPGQTRLTMRLTNSGRRKLRHAHLGHLTVHVTFAGATRMLGRTTAQVAVGS
jgi:hypothetical protein